MDYETLNQQLGDEYRDQLRRAQRADELWKSPISWTTEATLMEVIAVGTPNEAYSNATASLDRWRAFRAANRQP